MGGPRPHRERASEPTLGTVLVVDDEADVCESLAGVLRHALGVRVVVASSAQEGLAVLGREPVDVVVADYRMPETTGLEFVRAAASRVPGAGRILMTAYPEMEVAIEAINEGGVDAFLVKPLQAEEFVEAVRALLEERRRQRGQSQELARSLAGTAGGRPGAPRAPRAPEGTSL